MSTNTTLNRIYLGTSVILNFWAIYQMIHVLLGR
jgi:hypothetical protein